MQFYDIFNGDADGICALHQLRLEEPRDSVLVTGVKRDVRLLERVDASAGDELTVLDISLAVNADALSRLLSRGVRCRYFDHHAAGTIPQHPALKTWIDTSADVCTALLVDRYLNGRHRLWAVVAAFGDNLVAAAVRAASGLQVDEWDLRRLQELGEAMNYNAYGDTLDDLHYHPADLFESLRNYRDPREFINSEPVFESLRAACDDDMVRASLVEPEKATDAAAVVILPDAAWSRRVHGAFGNHLARSSPGRAHAVLVAKPGGYTVSIRAPLEKPGGADELCSRFPTGGGRAAAAGINFLPEADLGRFIEAFTRQYPA